MITWKQQLELHPELWDMNNWGWDEVHTQKLDRTKMRGFQKNRQILGFFFKCRDPKLAARKGGCGTRQVYNLLSRALSSPSEHEEPPLFKGLIPHQRLKQYQRHKPLSKLGSPSGDSGSLGLLFQQYPEFKQRLIQIIQADCNQKPYAQNTSAHFFHKTGLELLRKLGVSTNGWPFNRERLGQETFRKFYKETKAKLQAVTVKLAPVLTTPDRRQVYRELQLDEHTVDVFSSVYLNFGDEILPFRLSRTTLITLCDVDSEIILSWLLVFNKAAVKTDVEQVLKGIKRPRLPRLASDNPLIWIDPLGIMSESLTERLATLQMGTLCLDNAFVHLASCVERLICDQYGGTLNLGKPALPMARAIIEKGYDRFNVRYSHRHKSTTGSNPVDPIKETRLNAKNPPVLTVGDLERSIEAFVAEHNGRQMDKFQGLTPISRCESMLDTAWHPFDNYQLSQSEREHRLDTQGTIKVSKNGAGNPWINAFSLKYTARELSHPIEGDMKEVRISYDPHDLRILRVYDRYSNYLGQFWAPLSWQDYPFDYRTRRYIRNLVRKGVISSKDPLVEYFIYLLEHKSTPAISLEIYRICKAIVKNKDKATQSKIKRALKRARSQKNDGGNSKWVPKSSLKPAKRNIEINIKEMMYE